MSLAVFGTCKKQSIAHNTLNKKLDYFTVIVMHYIPHRHVASFVNSICINRKQDIGV